MSNSIELLNDLGITKEMISKIVKEVLTNIDDSNSSEPVLKKECDPSGLRLVRGNSVQLEAFPTGKEGDKVAYKEILNIKESPNMATGFLDIEESSFDWFLGYDELDYIIEGTLEITINGKKYSGKAGDVIFIPMNSAVTFSSPDHCKIFFATYPANWQDLCEEKN
ncbi:MAG: cupin domain-containing protein [Clostridia bacterium]|nr:cupin domain-containing protein [Clostridia bacterium]